MEVTSEQLELVAYRAAVQAMETMDGWCCDEGLPNWVARAVYDDLRGTVADTLGVPVPADSGHDAEFGPDDSEEE